MNQVRLISQITKTTLFLYLFCVFSTPTLAYENQLLQTSSNIWQYNTQSLSSFLDFIFKGRGGDPSSADLISTTLNEYEISELDKLYKENHTQLTQNLEKPIFKILDGDTQTTELSEKIEETKKNADGLFSSVQNLKSRILILQNKWPELSVEEIKSELTSLSSIFNQDLGGKGSNILTATSWLKNSWDSPILLNLSDKTQATQSQIDNLLNDVLTNGKISNPYVLEPIISHINELDQLIGTPLSESIDPNLYGFIRKTQEQLNNFERLSADGILILSESKSHPSKNQSAAIENLRSKILSSNLVPSANVFFSANTESTTNQVLELLALIDTNKVLLGNQTGQVISNVWLEEGSIIFRLVAVNTSRTQIHEKVLKLLLPSELKKEQVMSSSPEIIINHDSTENALVATADVILAPLESRTFFVEVKDVWNFNPVEIAGLKEQLKSLVDALRNTSGSTTAMATEKDINTILNKIELRQREAITPETRISSYRELVIEINSVEQKISSLKTLLMQSQSTGMVAGLTSGFRATSIKGLLLFLITSIVFFTLYTRALKTDFRNGNHRALQVGESLNFTKSHHSLTTRRRSGSGINWTIRVVIITLLSAGIGSLITSMAIKVRKIKAVNISQATISQSESSPIKEKQVLGSTSDSKPTPKKYPYEASVTPSKSDDIPVRSSPSISSPQISSIEHQTPITIFKKTGQWVQIMDNQNNGWWVNEGFVSQ